VVLLVLALIWGALAVSWLRHRQADIRLGDSVGSFRRHLRVLERATPNVVAPANRLRAPAPAHNYIPSNPVARSAPASAAGRTVVAGTRGHKSARSVPNPLVGGSYQALRRKQAQKRRRDVLMVLVAGTVGSLLLAVAGLGALWSVQVLFDLLLCSYLALLVRMQAVGASGRQARVAPLAPRRPSYRAAEVASVGYDFARASYGALEAAN